MTLNLKAAYSTDDPLGWGLACVSMAGPIFRACQLTQEHIRMLSQLNSHVPGSNPEHALCITSLFEGPQHLLQLRCTASREPLQHLPVFWTDQAHPSLPQPRRPCHPRPGP